MNTFLSGTRDSELPVARPEERGGNERLRRATGCRSAERVKGFLACFPLSVIHPAGAVGSSWSGADSMWFCRALVTTGLQRSGMQAGLG